MIERPLPGIITNMDQPEAFRKHLATRTRRPPAVLYKYMNTQGAIAMFERKTLLFRCPTGFNDPFDSQWDPFWQCRTPQYQKIERDLLRQALVDPNSWPEDADPLHKRLLFDYRMEVYSKPRELRERIITEFLDELQRDPDESICDEALSLQRRLRIHSFTENFQSLLMWSHYADDHKGIVVGFDSGILENYFTTGLEPVNYSKSLPPMMDMHSFAQNLVYGTNRDAFSDDEDRKIALYKSDGWAYENEWRMIWRVDDGAPDCLFPALPEQSVAEITIGSRCDHRKSDQIIQLAMSAFPETKVFQAKPHNYKFEIQRTERT